jgi:hypothetical protein
MLSNKLIPKLASDAEYLMDRQSLLVGIVDENICEVLRVVCR